MFLNSEALILQKTWKNGVNYFEEAGLSNPIFAEEAGLFKILKTDIFFKNVFWNIFFQRYCLQSFFNMFFGSLSFSDQLSMCSLRMMR